MSRPVTSRSGVEGVVVEAVLTGEASEAPRAGPAHHAAGPAPADHVTGPTRGLVLVGEPEVGKYAVAARRRLELLAEASARIGTTLDVTRTARELAEMAVPRLADYVTIDVPEAVLRGEESAHPATELHRAVVHGVRDDCPFYPAGRRVELRAGTPTCGAWTAGRRCWNPI
ncbi:hypothetical protein GCM10020254_75880 [Streptomyces goshikiensis]